VFCSMHGFVTSSDCEKGFRPADLLCLSTPTSHVLRPNMTGKGTASVEILVRS
jgi:hypothetical protein